MTPRLQDELQGLYDFQYPRSDRIGCDSGRYIIGDPAMRHFQYPRSDRIGCDVGYANKEHLRKALSVSPLGSNWL